MDGWMDGHTTTNGPGSERGVLPCRSDPPTQLSSQLIVVCKLSVAVPLPASAASQHAALFCPLNFSSHRWLAVFGWCVRAATRVIDSADLQPAHLMADSSLPASEADAGTVPEQLPSPLEQDASGAEPAAAAVVDAPTAATATDDDCAEALLCARYGETDDLVALLNLKVDVNHKDVYTLSTCLHYAAANGHLDCIRALVEHKASYSANSSGNFPLHWALDQSQSVEAVKLLMDS